MMQKDARVCKLNRILLLLVIVSAAALILSLVWLLVLDAPASARLPKLGFEIKGDEVLVSERGRGLVQRVPIAQGALPDGGGADLLRNPDINFDSYPDLLVPYSLGLQNGYYDGWVWVPAEHKFAYDPRIRRLSSPLFDEQTRTISTFEHGSATDNEGAIYQYIDGILTQTWRQTQTYDPKTELFTISTYERGPGGAMELTSKRQLSEQQLRDGQ